MKWFALAVNVALGMLPAAPSASQPLEAAKQKFSRCLSDGVKMLDDRKSDAASVARGVLFYCNSEYWSMLESMSRSAPVAGTAYSLSRDFRDTNIDQAIMAVLLRRKLTP